MTAILKKELWSFFGTWIAWLVMAGFSIVGALFLFFFENDANIFEIGSASLQSYFNLVPWLFMFLIPALTMKTLAEEEQRGTLLWLFSQPLKVWDIVLGKYLSVFVVGLCCLLPSLIYLFTIYTLGVPSGNLDGGATAGSYCGLLVLLAAFSSVGIASSALAKNQITAYLLGVFLCFLLYFGIEQLASYKLLGGADYLLSSLGFYQHFIAFTRGLIDTRDIAYFILVTCLCLFLAKVVVENKK